jgi:maltooligosyltrehalose trehalohydrolase
VLCSGETDGYYADYAETPIHHLGRCLAQGFAYQGEASAYRNAPRGETSAHLPAPAFVGFLQNHDQVGNRALGERIHQIAPAPAIRAAVAILLLAPEIPLLFMGEEFAASTPFLFFCDFEPGLRAAISQGRRREFAKFKRYADPAAQATIPDPNQLETFLSARLDWKSLQQPEHAEWLAYYRGLLALRREEIVPRLPGMAGGTGQFKVSPSGGLTVAWRLGDGSTLHLLANLTDNPIQATSLPGTSLYATAPIIDGVLPAWQVIWTLRESVSCKKQT